ncbi:hypothetical protein MBLNU230_g6307t1 [Neophaeotheca triangularis]
MAIQPGLQRISNLLALGSSPHRWKAIHVAGTNGKGSTSVYISGMLEAYNASQYRKATGAELLSCGRFTSPHLVKPRDSIQVSSRRRARKRFKGGPFGALRHELRTANAKHDIGASEFELLTALAFRMFWAANIDIGVVEAGLGGRLDATNVLGRMPWQSPRSDGSNFHGLGDTRLVSVFTKIGLDHQDFLGSTLSEVAGEKAGIIGQGVPVVSDMSQDHEAQAAISNKAREMSSKEVQLSDILPLTEIADLGLLKRTLPTSELHNCIVQHLYQESTSAEVEENLTTMLASDRADDVPEHVKQNTSVAFRATWTALHRYGRLPMLGFDPKSQEGPADYASAQKDLTGLVRDMLSVPEKTVFPGRQQRLAIRTTKDTDQEALLDGAHNAQSAEVLGIAVNKLRATDMTTNPDKNGAVTYVLAASDSKDVTSILKPLVKPGDSVFAVRFGAVEGMPWVKAKDPKAILEAASTIVDGANTLHLQDCEDDIVGAMAQACERADGGTLVVAGSLYLVGQVLSLCQGYGD